MMNRTWDIIHNILRHHNDKKTYDANRTNTGKMVPQNSKSTLVEQTDFTSHSDLHILFRAFD